MDNEFNYPLAESFCGEFLGPLDADAYGSLLVDATSSSVSMDIAPFSDPFLDPNFGLDVNPEAVDDFSPRYEERLGIPVIDMPTSNPVLRSQLSFQQLHPMDYQFSTQSSADFVVACDDGIGETQRRQGILSSD